MPSLAIDDNHLWTRRFLWLLASVVVFRIVYLFLFVDFRLAGDETYYWDWGRQPDWGYFSKPPLIAWIMAAIRMAFGYTWWAVRLTAILFGTGTLGLLFVLGRALFDARTGFLGAALFVLTPACTGLNLALNTDPPLLLCWAASLLLFWKVVQAPQLWGRWLALALCIGIGSLAKQMMLVFPLLMVLFTAFVPSQRGLLRRPAFWSCLVLSASFLLPTLWWNNVHGWPMVKHTEDNISATHTTTLLDHLASIVTFPAIQAAMFSPVTLWLIIFAMVAIWRRWRTCTVQEQLLWTFSAPALGVFVLLSFYKEVNPNWPATFYLAAMVLAAGCLRVGDQSKQQQRFQTALRVGASLTVLTHMAAPAISWFGLQGGAADPFRDLRGWQATAQQVSETFAKLPRPKETLILVADHRHFVSQLAFWMPEHPQIYRWNRDGNIDSQYEVWPTAADRIGADMLIVLPNNANKNYAPRKVPPVIQESFSRLDKIADVDVDVGNGTRRSLQLFLGRNMRRWPPTPPIDQSSP